MITSEFIKAGKAVFTINNPQGKYFTYKINKKVFKENGKETTLFFAMVKKGQNWFDYKYIGIYNPEKNKVFTGIKSNFQYNSIEYKVLDWALKTIDRATDIPKGYEIRHEGKCGKCGKRLTTPESLEYGIGPECIKRLHGDLKKKVQRIKKIKAILR